MKKKVLILDSLVDSLIPFSNDYDVIVTNFDSIVYAGTNAWKGHAKIIFIEEFFDTFLYDELHRIARDCEEKFALDLSRSINCSGSFYLKNDVFYFLYREFGLNRAIKWLFCIECIRRSDDIAQVDVLTDSIPKTELFDSTQHCLTELLLQHYSQISCIPLKFTINVSKDKSSLKRIILFGIKLKVSQIISILFINYSKVKLLNGKVKSLLIEGNFLDYVDHHYAGFLSPPKSHRFVVFDNNNFKSWANFAALFFGNMIFIELKSPLQQFKTKLAQLYREKQFHQISGSSNFNIGSETISRAFQQFYQDLIPILTVEIRHSFNEYCSIFAKFSVLKVFITDLLSVKSRLLLEAVKFTNIRSYFIDHGTMLHNPILPSGMWKAPEIVLSGNYDNSFCFNDPQKLVRIRVGELFIDRYFKYGLEFAPVKRQSSPDENRKFKVLILGFEDNSYARLDRADYISRYYYEIVRVASYFKYNNIDFDIKPYGSERYLKKIVDIMDYRDLLQDRIIYTGQFHEYINDYDIVISNISTCFVETIFAGKIPIFLEPAYCEGKYASPLRLSLNPYLFVARNATELVQAIFRIKSKDLLSPVYVGEQKQYYENAFFGTNDGSSHKRIFSTMLES